MKKILFILTVIAGLLMSSNAEARRIRIPVSNDIPKVATLPDSSYYKTDEGTHLDLGYIEKDGKRTLVLFSESKPDTYYDISDEYAEAIRQDLNVEEGSYFRDVVTYRNPDPRTYILGQMGWQPSFLRFCCIDSHRPAILPERLYPGTSGHSEKREG